MPYYEQNRSGSGEEVERVPRIQLSDEEYAALLERLYKIIERTEELDQVTHHWVWEVWRILHFGKADTAR
jgi:Asp-tRNA(Asn)/Glu-tRNA(Gln) amidotransferase C subunit